MLAQLKSLRIGTLLADVVCHPSSDKLAGLIREAVEKIRDQYNLSDINKLEVIASARNAYKKCGNDPNRYRPSADALLRRIVKGSDLYKINNVVDVLNLVSIRSCFSIGGYDRVKLKGDIELGLGQKGEPYSGIGRGPVNITNLIVLRDKYGAFGSPTSDSERTMITGTTKEILFIFFDFELHTSLEENMNYCDRLLREYCQAKETGIRIFDFSDDFSHHPQNNLIS
jgi:DNA/RNA-binding domain of Phe-tRNA-synthetase-like protein